MVLGVSVLCQALWQCGPGRSEANLLPGKIQQEARTSVRDVEQQAAISAVLVLFVEKTIIVLFPTSDKCV